MKLEAICIISDNFSAMKEFYKDVLRANAEGDEAYAEFLVDGAKLSLFSREAMEGMAPGSMHNAGFGSMVIEFKVFDVDEEYEILKKKGVNFVKLPTTQPWGIRSVWFRDPDGNIINFFANVNG